MVTSWKDCYCAVLLDSYNMIDFTPEAFRKQFAWMNLLFDYCEAVRGKKRGDVALPTPIGTPSKSKTPQNSTTTGKPSKESSDQGGGKWNNRGGGGDLNGLGSKGTPPAANGSTAGNQNTLHGFQVWQHLASTSRYSVCLVRGLDDFDTIFVLKMPATSRKNNSLRNEYAILTHLANSNVPHARLAKVCWNKVSSKQPPALMMDYLPALRSPLERRQQPHSALQRFRELLHQIHSAFDGLHRLHVAGVVHLDIKPANMRMIEQPQSGAEFDYCVAFIDFDIAQFLWSAPFRAGCGTWRWMAPEMRTERRNCCHDLMNYADRHRTGGASDYYSLGRVVLLWFFAFVEDDQVAELDLPTWAIMLEDAEQLFSEYVMETGADMLEHCLFRQLRECVLNIHESSLQRRGDDTARSFFAALHSKHPKLMHFSQLSPDENKALFVELMMLLYGLLDPRTRTRYGHEEVEKTLAAVRTSVDAVGVGVGVSVGVGG